MVKNNALGAGIGAHNFDNVGNQEFGQSTFDRDSTHQTEFNQGMLIPVYCDEILPGDVVNLSTTVQGRITTLLHPIMSNLYVNVKYFFVPNRTTWTKWKLFQGEQENPDQNIDIDCPMISPPPAGYASRSIFDYIGLPTLQNGFENNVWHLRAYNKIWNEYFRDEDLQDSVVQNTGDTDVYTNYNLLPVGKVKDYFTACRPWAQKGAPVTMPLSGVVEVVQDGYFKMQSHPAITDTSYPSLNINKDNEVHTYSGGFKPVHYVAGLAVDLDQAQGISVNELRQAVSLARLLESDARGGSRYVERLLNVWGVTPDDGTLQRAEYLGGTTSDMQTQAIPQNASTDATSPQGNLSAIGTLTAHGNWTRRFKEHGVLLGLAWVRSDLVYQQGLDRMFSRKDRYDYAEPMLANLGEQAVLSKEIYCIGGSADQYIFGYIGRYDEYRFKQSRVSGAMRSNSVDPSGQPNKLDVWHLAQDFSTRPHLNADFMHGNAPVDRVIAVQGTTQFIFDMFFKVRHTRRLPVVSVPSIMSGF